MKCLRWMHSFLLGQLAGATYRLAGTWRRMAILEKVERMPAEQRRRWQLQRLRQLLAHAFEKVPFYRDWARAEGVTADDFRTLEDLHVLPVLTKRHLQDHFDELRADGSRYGGVRVNHTGGSTGEPVSFCQDSHYRAWANADKQRAYLRCGYRLGEPIAFLWGSDADSKAHKSRFSRWVDRWGRNLLWINTFDLHEDDLPRIAEALRRHEPVLIVGYVRSLTMYARYLEESGDARPRVRAVQASAEVLTTDDRRLIEGCLDAPVFDRYGCREVGIIAHECEAHSGLHISAGANIVELLDASSRRPASPGRVVVTNLHNFATPFIRYDTQDVGQWADGQCSCGRSTRRLESVLGRASDLIVAPSGRLLHEEFFTHLFYNARGVRQFQVIQETRGLLRIRIVPRPGADLSRLQQRLREAIARHADPAFDVVFETVASIPVTASGKTRFTISKVASDL